MTCDIKLDDGNYCQNEPDFFGRWIAYCKTHETEGKQLDWSKTYDNEIADNENFSGIDGEVSDMIEKHLF